MTGTGKNLTEGRLGKQVLLFALPLMLSNILQVLFNMADIAVVGRFSGAAALGSVGSTAMMVQLLTGFLMGVGSGVNVLTARHYGAESYKDLEQTVHTSLLLCLGAGLFLLASGELGVLPLMRVLGTKDELIDGAVLYMRIYMLGLPAMGIYNFGNGVFSAIGDTRRPLIFLSVAGGLNVVLNLFFVIVCGMDVAGVALATVISQYISAALILLALFRCRDVYGLRLGSLRPTGDKAKALLEIGLPAAVQNVIFSTANLVIQGGVNTFDAVTVEGNSAASNADNLVYDVMNAFYVACTSFMGQNYGAGKKKRVLRSYFVSLAYSFGIAAIMGGLLILFGRPFLRLFTTEPAVIAIGYERLKLMAASYCVSAFMDCTIYASRGLGKSLIPTVVVILGSCVFRIVWVYTVFAYFGTITSLYLLYVFSWAITALFEILYFARIYKEQMALFSGEDL